MLKELKRRVFTSKKMVVISVMTLVLSALMLSGCGGNSASKLVGQWEREDVESISAPFDELEFFSDNTYSSDDPNYNGNYSIDGDRIKFTGILVEPITCSFEANNKNLTLTYEDDTWTFVKADKKD